MSGSKWQDYGREYESGLVPFYRRAGWLIFGAVIFLAIMAFVLQVATAPLRLASRAAAVVEQQIDPAELLRKYEWFKNAAAALDKKTADVKVYDARRIAMAKGYEGLPRQDWPRDDREQYNLWESEVAGIKASYNTLAADYNAQMAKLNWRFCNVGQLPRGAETPLPREFKPYIEQ